MLAAAVAAVALIAAYVLLAAWGDRPTVFLLALGLVFGLLLLLDWVFDLFGPPLWRLAKSLSHSLGGAFTRDPEVDRIAAVHPKLAGWLGRRWGLEHWTGRYLTVIVVLTAWFLLGFFTIARDLAATSSLVAYDPQLSALVRAFRSPAVTRVLWIATVSGDTRTELVLTGVVVALLLMWGRRAEALLAAFVVAVGSEFGSVIKTVAGRTRPPIEFMLIRSPLSRSFPSGHALGSILFYGVVAFVLLRATDSTPRRRLAVVLACAAAIFLVGLSRVYLGVHWPTDVLASWCLGAAWLTVTLGAFLCWERYGHPPRRADALLTRRVRVAVTVASAVAVFAVVVTGAQADPLLRTVAQGPPPKRLSSRDGRAWLAALPRFSEKLDGTRQEPVSLVFVGTSAQLDEAFERAGWQVADRPSVGGVIQTAIAAVENKPYPTAPMTPSFIGGRANDVGFEKPQGPPTARRRHHARFWRTQVLLDGRQVWVGTASFDAGIEIGRALPFPTHRIDPAVDKERDLVARELTATGRVREIGMWQLTHAEAGTNAQGDQFFTDGAALLLEAR
jgi:undecaprenyl-diphosphatase